MFLSVKAKQSRFEHVQSSQGINFNMFGGQGVRGLLCENFVCDIFLLLATALDQMVLGPVSCPAKIHCTAVIALQHCTAASSLSPLASSLGSRRQCISKVPHLPQTRLTTIDQGAELPERYEWRGEGQKCPS